MMMMTMMMQRLYEQVVVSVVARTSRLIRAFITVVRRAAAQGVGGRRQRPAAGSYM